MPVLQRRFQFWVREHMSSRGWNQSELARQLGMARMVVSTYLRDPEADPPPPRPGVEIVEKFATAFGIDPSELLLPVPAEEKIGV